MIDVIRSCTLENIFCSKLGVKYDWVAWWCIIGGCTIVDTVPKGIRSHFPGVGNHCYHED